MLRLYLMLASGVPMAMVSLLGIPSDSLIVKRTFNIIGGILLVNQIVSVVLYITFSLKGII